MCLVCLFFFFFFFKQKTAYEMRISDWSSDVCSSDLLRLLDGGRTRLVPPAADGAGRWRPRCARDPVGARRRRAADGDRASGQGDGGARQRRRAEAGAEFGRASWRESVCKEV